MKKFLYLIYFLVIVFISLSYFANSKYFFNHFIAKEIKEYGFDYSKVDGVITKGFIIENLKYKDEILANRVELKFNPFSLLDKKIYINKLHLTAVNKPTLNRLINDFKLLDGSDSSFVFDFIIEDIILTINPFNIDDFKVNQNVLTTKYIKFINNRLDIGDVLYIAKTNYGDIEFKGKYDKKILYVNDISLNRFSLDNFLHFLNSIQSDNGSSSNVPFLPKKVYIDLAKVNLKEFSIGKIKLNDFNISLKNSEFDIKNLLLKQGKISLNYSNSDFKADIDAFLNNKELTFKTLNLNILHPNRFKSLIDSNSSSSASIDILQLSRLKIDKLNLQLQNLAFKKEKIKAIKLKGNKIDIDIKNKTLTSKLLFLSANLSDTFINIKASIDKKINIDKLTIKSNNLDRLIKNFNSTNSKSSNFKVAFIPNNFYIKRGIIDIKKLSFEPFIIKSAKAKIKNISGKIDKFTLNSGKLFVDVASNWGEANLDGVIKNSNYFANGEYKAKQALLDEYDIPLIAKHFKPLKVDGRFGFNNLDIDISLEGKDILKDIKDIDILSSKNNLKYDYNSSNLIWSIDAKAKSPYTGVSRVKNILTYKDILTYSGEVIINRDIFYIKDTKNLLQDLKISYSGNSDGIDIKLKSRYLSGELKDKNYNGGVLKIKNIKPIKLSDIADIKDNSIKISKLLVTSNINFNKILPINGNIDINSNIVNIKGKYNYNNKFSSKLSINRLKVKNGLNIKPLLPLNLNLDISNSLILAKLKNRLLNGDIKYHIKNSNILGNIKTKTINLELSGNKKRLNYKLSSKSLKRSLNELSYIFKMNKKIDIDGLINCSGIVDNLNSITFAINSPAIKYSKNKIENLNIKSRYKDNQIAIDNFKFKFKNFKIFSNNQFRVNLKNSQILISNLILNNSLKINGDYNYQKLVGKFNIDSNSFRYEDKDYKVDLTLKNRLSINREKISIDGKVIINSGKIKKNMKYKNVADNEDIIILQRQQAKMGTNFAKNIKLNLEIDSKKGIEYIQPDSYFVLKPKLKIVKNFNQLSKFIGVVDLDHKGYYILNGKRLKLIKGLITFKGRSSVPYLNIVLRYNSKDYDINIYISGTPSEPILYFSSNPPLTKDQILAYLLFGDESAAGTHSQDAMLNLIGSSLAKSFLGSIGIKLDHISIKENGFSIGKSITKNITLYYEQENKKSAIKTRIDITKNIHTEIKINDEKQSADIIFSQEY